MLRRSTRRLNTLRSICKWSPIEHIWRLDTPKISDVPEFGLLEITRAKENLSRNAMPSAVVDLRTAIEVLTNAGVHGRAMLQPVLLLLAHVLLRADRHREALSALSPHMEHFVKDFPPSDVAHKGLVPLLSFYTEALVSERDPIACGCLIKPASKPTPAPQLNKWNVRAIQFIADAKRLNGHLFEETEFDLVLPFLSLQRAVWAATESNYLNEAAFNSGLDTFDAVTSASLPTDHWVVGLSRFIRSRYTTGGVFSLQYKSPPETKSTSQPLPRQPESSSLSESESTRPAPSSTLTIEAVASHWKDTLAFFEHDLGWDANAATSQPIPEKPDVRWADTYASALLDTVIELRLRGDQDRTSGQTADLRIALLLRANKIFKDFASDASNHSNAYLFRHGRVFHELGLAYAELESYTFAVGFFSKAVRAFTDAFGTENNMQVVAVLQDHSAFARGTSRRKEADALDRQIQRIISEQA